MDSGDAFWMSDEVADLVRAHDIGGLVRFVRRARHLSQLDLSSQVNVSASTLSRLESGLVKSPDLRLVMSIAEKLNIPVELIGVALGINEARSPSFVATLTPVEEDPIHRRSFLTLTGLTVPAVLMGRLDDALTGVSRGVDAEPGELVRRFALVRAMYDRGENGKVLGLLPNLLELADQELEPAREDALKRYCLVHDLATDLLDKVGLVGEARITAQNSYRVSRQCGSPLVMAAADRGLTIVLRHEGKVATANRVSMRAANLIESTGLTGAREGLAYVQVMCTHSYVAAQNDDRATAIAAITEAERAAAYLDGRIPDTLARRAATNARMYRVSVHWALGDAGAAVDVGRRVDVMSLPTPERRARHFTDMARAWWARGRPEETAEALLAALSHAPAEVTDRTRIRAIADDLARRHRAAAPVRALTHRIAGVAGD